jgi:hypothetical protein
VAEKVKTGAADLTIPHGSPCFLKRQRDEMVGNKGSLSQPPGLLASGRPGHSGPLFRRR